MLSRLELVGAKIQVGVVQQKLQTKCSPVAQLVEQVAVNHLVAGSSPARGAIYQNPHFVRARYMARPP